MMNKVENGVFSFITDLMKSYGIPIEFRYDEKLDILNEFRKSIRLRVENQTVFDELTKKYTDEISGEGNLIHNLGVYNRTPLSKNPDIGNNMDIEVYSNKLNSEYGIEMRYAMYATSQYTVRLLCDTHEMANVFELLYLFSLSGKSKTVTLDFNLGEDVEPIEEVQYTVAFQELNSIGTLNGSNLRYLDFSFMITGLFFTPFYKDEYKLESIVVSVHAMNKSTKPTHENATSENLVNTKTFTMPPNQVN